MSKAPTFKLKQYLHFTDRLIPADVKWVHKYVSDPIKVKEHKFFPFIHRPMKQRRFRRPKDGPSPKKQNKREKTIKPRSINYANHLDRCIYSHYASKLVEAYELQLKKEPLVNNASLAYRSKEHAVKSLATPQMAKEVFDLMRSFPEQEFRVVAMDVSGFFDTLCHKKIKASWKQMIGGMDDDHFAVYKNIVRYSYIDYHEVFKAFTDHHKKKSPKYLKSSKSSAFSPSVKEFRKRIIDQGLVREGEGRRFEMGIPQGSPISPVLANIYMLDFDRYASKLLNDIGGYYRRYSDDIILIYPLKYHSVIYQPLMDEIRYGDTQLEINASKNQLLVAIRKLDGSLAFYDDTVTPWKLVDTFDYLGFSFSGNVVRIKSASLSKYYRKMKKTVRRSAFYGATTGRSTGQNYVFKNMIFKKHTHIGAKRRLMYKRGPVDAAGKFKMIRTKKMDWGNFISYSQLAERIFEGEDRKAIKRQMKRHMTKVRCEIKKGTIKRRLRPILKSNPTCCS